MKGITRVTRAGGKQVYRVAFVFRGVQCRETVALPHSKANDTYCQRLKADIERRIELGTFIYSEFFPESRRAALFGHGGRTRTLRQALEALRDRTHATLELSTWKPYARDIDHVLVPRFGALRLGDFKASDLRTFVTVDCAGRSLKRIRNLLLPLRAVLAEAVEDEIIPANPMDRVDIAKLVPVEDRESSYEPDPYTEDELRTLLATLPEPERWAFQLWAYTGMRTGELIGLRWPRIDLQARELRITEATVEGEDKARTKTKAGLRTITLLPAAVEAIEGMRKFTQLAGDRFTINPRGDHKDKRWGVNKLAAVWERAHKGTGIRARNPYQLRHTFASQLLSQGENVALISRLLGHKTIEMTMRHYARFVEQGERLGLDRPPRRYGMQRLWAEPAAKEA